MKFKAIISLVLVVAAIIFFIKFVLKVHVGDSIEIRRTLPSADAAFIYEGLPHQTFEADSLKAEKKRDDIIYIAKFPFYTPKVEVRGNRLIHLKSIASSSNSYTSFSGEKKCGGFHPDYALVWSEGSNNYAILFCYGCNEALIVNGSQTYRYDFENFAKLKKLLAPFKLKRPNVPRK